MIKYIHREVVYYFDRQEHLDQAKAASYPRTAGSILPAVSSQRLMYMAEFVIDRETNAILKNRRTGLETVLDAFFKEVTFDNLREVQSERSS